MRTYFKVIAIVGAVCAVAFIFEPTTAFFFAGVVWPLIFVSIAYRIVRYQERSPRFIGWDALRGILGWSLVIVISGVVFFAILTYVF